VRTASGSRRVGVLAAVLVVLATAIGGCGLRAPQPPVNGVAGTIVSTDDTGLPDSPDGGGWIVAIPAEHIEEVVALARKGNRGFSDSDLPYTRFVLVDASAKKWGVAVAAVDDKGRFTLEVTGPHLLCRAVETRAGKRLTGGCDDVSLPAGGTVRATVGEGGFRAGLA
jgi:hypothetical protein